MRVIIAGMRDYYNYEVLKEVIKDAGFDITTILQGGASGVDNMAVVYGRENSIPVESHAANWKIHGKAAGPIRNREMAANADALIAIWNKKSSGTKNMIEEAKKRNLLIWVKYVD